MIIPLQGDNQTTKIRSLLSQDEAKQTRQVLINNADMLAWTTTDMPRVHPNVMTYKLSIYKEARRVVQNKQKLGEEKMVAVKEETDKLLKA